MKLLIFAHDSTLYGASQSLLTLLKELSFRHNANILLLLPYDGQIENELNKHSIKYKVIPYPRCTQNRSFGYSLWQNFLFNLNYKKRLNTVMSDLNSVIQSFKPDIIYTSTSVISVGYSVAKKFGIPHVWHVREFGDLDYNLAYLPSMNNIRKKIASSTQTIFVSQAIKKHWVKKDFPNYKVIYNGIVSEISNAEINIKKNSNRFNIGIIGAIQEGKGHHILVAAFSEFVKSFPNAQLLIYGDIVENDFYLNLQKVIVAEALIERVIFKGFETDQELIYSNIDVLVSCSTMEAFGRTLVEGMNYRIPVIANAQGGVLEIIEDNVSGLLFDGTVKGLIKSLHILTDKNIYEKLSSNAYKMVATKFTVKKYVNLVLEVLEKSLKNNL